METFYNIFVENTLDYIVRMLPGLLGATIVFFALRPWRLKRLAGRKLISPRLREGALLLFWLFCGGMAMLTLTPPWFDWRALIHGLKPIHPSFFTLGTVNLTPFQTFSFEVHSLFFLLGNIVMFMPFGFFSALLWRDFDWKRALTAGFVITLSVECCQLFIGRAFDIDDLMLNTLGVLCGYWIWRAASRLFPRLTARFHVISLKETL